MSIIGSNVLAGASGQGGGYVIENSLRFRSSASAYLNRTPGSASNQRTFTFSMWFKRGELGSNQDLYVVDQDSNHQFFIELNSTNNIRVFDYQPSAFNLQLVTTAVYRDPSAWYHLVVAVDTTQATAANRCVIYVNGSQVTALSTATYPTQNYTTMVDTTQPCRIGNAASVSRPFDGYLTEINFIDGQALTPSDFGDYNIDTGVWQPAKYVGTYGTNGFYLNFSDNTSTTTLGYDQSTNTNNWTANNISLTAGATYDSMTDTPTPYADGGNYAVMNPLAPTSVYNAVMSNGNLTATLTYSSQVNTYSSMPLPTTGKWYWESTVVASNYGVIIGIRSTVNSSLILAGGTGGYSYYNANGNKYDGATASAYGTSWYGASRTDVIGVAYDADTRELTFYLNGTSQGVAFTVTAGEYYPSASHVSGSGSHTEHYNFGQRPFAYTPPTGFKSLHTGNLPDSAIENGAEYFAATTYTGTGATQSISNDVNGVSFQPDFVWIKNRSAAYSHYLFDSVRGVYNRLFSDNTNAESPDSSQLTAFNSDGFALGVGTGSNSTGLAHVGWQWKAGGAAVTNTAGSITSQVSASPTAGFSVVTYTGTGAAATVGHGLGVAPSMVIVKKRSAAGDQWYTYHSSNKLPNANAADNRVFINLTAASNWDSQAWNNTNPTSSVFSIGSSTEVSASGATFVAYCFSEVPGYSKFGSYTGNGSADGPFVYLGFRPAFVMVKRTDSAGSWVMYDTARGISNDIDEYFYADTSNAELGDGTTLAIDSLSNGFKIRHTSSYHNASGGTYIYMAFAETDFANALAR